MRVARIESQELTSLGHLIRPPPRAYGVRGKMTGIWMTVGRQPGDPSLAPAEVLMEVAGAVLVRAPELTLHRLRRAAAALSTRYQVGRGQSARRADLGHELVYVHGRWWCR